MTVTRRAVSTGIDQTGTVAMVTGGTSGIGAVVVLALAVRADGGIVMQGPGLRHRGRRRGRTTRSVPSVVRAGDYARSASASSRNSSTRTFMSDDVCANETSHCSSSPGGVRTPRFTPHSHDSSAAPKSVRL